MTVHRTPRRLQLLALLLLGLAALASATPTLPTAAAARAAAVASDTTWNLAGSPYTIAELLTVERGATLSVEPGVELRFAAGAGLIIEGALRAEGSAAAPILFTGVTKAPAAWRGISAFGTSEAHATISLRHATVEYAGLNALGDALYMEHAQASIEHSTFRQASRHGIHGGIDAGVEVVDSSFTANAGYAMRLADLSVPSRFARLSASDNGQDVIALGGSGAVVADDRWEDAGLPYLIEGQVEVRRAATLTIEAGVEARFAPNTSVQIQGMLRGEGSAAAPVVITGASQAPGSWQGLVFHGTPEVPALGVFTHTTVEYGGKGTVGGNIYVHSGQVAISDSIIRRSAGSGIVLWSQASGSSVERSQIVENANYGIYTPDGVSWQAALAANNWWGDPSGPTVEGGCNPGGLGSRVSNNVIVRPFLTSANASVPSVAPAAGYQISVAPQQWYAPANGGTRIYVTITLRDGAGRPVAGKRVRLNSSLGTVTDGGLTDLQGQSIAYLTSPAAGDATLTPLIDIEDSCEFARGATAVVTFIPPAADGLLAEGGAAPYMSGNIDISPLPVTRGVPTTLRATLTNPNDFPVVVDGTFGYAQAGLGQVFGPIGTASATIPARGSASVSILWTPPSAGHYCVEFAYDARREGEPQLNQVRSGRMPVFQFNVTAQGGGFMPPRSKGSLEQAQQYAAIGDDMAFGLATYESVFSIPGGLLQGQLFGNIIGFIFGNGGAISCGMMGGTSCQAWQGPSMSLPGGGVGSLFSDPPSQQYRELIVITPTTFTPHPISDKMPAGRASALNELMAAGLELHDNIFGAVVSYDRYNGAVEANELAWAARQTGAYLYYLNKTSLAMERSADAFDALVAELRTEGFTSLTPSPEAYALYRTRLINEGWNATELEAARIAGLGPATLEAIRQDRISRDPASLPGDTLTRWTNFAAALREAGQGLRQVPAYGGSVGGAGLATTAAEGDSAQHNLARVFDTATSVQVGNPTDKRATVTLKVRPLDLPAGWAVSLSERSLVLDPGQQLAVTVTLRPGAAAPQGSQPRVALEGFIDGELIGGVVVDLLVPERVAFDGKLRISLPLVLR
jgi:hypothetical protein